MITALSVRFEYSGSQGSVSGLCRKWRSKPSGISVSVMHGLDISCMRHQSAARGGRQIVYGWTSGSPRATADRNVHKSVIPEVALRRRAIPSRFPIWKAAVLETPEAAQIGQA